MLPRIALGPDRPAEAVTRDGSLAVLRVQRVLDLPVACKQALVWCFQNLGLHLVFGINAFDKVEEEQEGKLLSVADGVRVAAAKEVITNLVNRPPHVGR